MKCKQNGGWLKPRSRVVMSILVAVVIFVGVKSFWVRQSLAISKRKLVAGLGLARDYARSGRNPGGGVLGYVEVTVDKNGVMEAWPNGVGSSYYSVDVSIGGVVIGVEDGNVLLFEADDGRMLKDSEGLLVPFSTAETVEIVLSGGRGVGQSRVVKVNSLGLIGEE